jgi:hypothetical protein
MKLKNIIFENILINIGMRRKFSLALSEELDHLFSIKAH